MFHLQHGVADLFADGFNDLCIDGGSCHVRDVESVFCFSAFGGDFCSPDTQAILSEYSCDI